MPSPMRLLRAGARFVALLPLLGVSERGGMQVAHVRLTVSSRSLARLM